MTGAGDQGARGAGAREWTALAILALPCIVYAMDLTVLNLAAPSISSDLHPTPTELLWIVDIYGFVTAGFLITMGTLGDRIGRRRLLMIGSAAFAVASLMAAASSSVAMLIASRALLGIAGATLAPSTLSLIFALFSNERQRTFAVGVWIASFSAGAALGPLVGGALLESHPWGWVFLPAIPVMALVLALGPRLLPEYKAPGAGRVDLASAVLSIAVVLPVVLGIKHLAQNGFDATAVGAIAVGLAFGWAFVSRQRRLEDPLLDLRLFTSRRFDAALAANTVGFLVNFGSLLFIAQYLQAVLDLSPIEAGLWSVPAALAFIAGSLLTPLLVRRVSPPTAVAAGLAVAAGGFVLVAQVGAESGLAYLVVGWSVFSLGLSTVFTLAADLMVSTAPAERAGAASAISETSSELGGALGIALLGAIGAAVYRSGLPGDDGVSETIGDLVQGGGATADAARVAFVDGMQAAAAISAVLAIAAAAAVVASLRRDRAPAEACDQVAVADARP
jgi:MFS transporter, DHA2 family, multidrug resistance protein